MKMGQKPTHIQQIPRSKPVSYLDQGMVNNLTINPYIYIYITEVFEVLTFLHISIILKKKKLFLTQKFQLKKKQLWKSNPIPKNAILLLLFLLYFSTLLLTVSVNSEPQYFVFPKDTT